VCVYWENNSANLVTYCIQLWGLLCVCVCVCVCVLGKRAVHFWVHTVNIYGVIVCAYWGNISATSVLTLYIYGGYSVCIGKNSSVIVGTFLCIVMLVTVCVYWEKAVQLSVHNLNIYGGYCVCVMGKQQCISCYIQNTFIGVTVCVCVCVCIGEKSSATLDTYCKY
jgi:hypothetical protein